MIMSDESWFVVRNTPGVTGFIGSSGRGAKPFPVQESEIEKVMAVQGRIDDSLLTIEWKLDEVVEIKNGPLSGNVGAIHEINFDNKTAVVNIDVFGRMTPTEVSLDDLKKVK
jgi:transcriptional antiterminator NusG